MSKRYEVGYGKPPKHAQFKPGNKAAKGRRSPRKEALALPEIIDKALRSKRKIKRGDQVFEMPVAEILAERLVQAMTTGTAREMALIVAMLERYAPAVMASAPETLEVTYHRAEGSTVPLPPVDLWKGDKS